MEGLWESIKNYLMTAFCCMWPQEEETDDFTYQRYAQFY